ncbi:dual specificity protein phosphatase 18 [Embiotoca jacksoni]|uniref:dual specificity protein phosphatase 18 n=1 Tax=Embiotoca jacksoni TaxID=100190 RepID=UPI003704A972
MNEHGPPQLSGLCRVTRHLYISSCRAASDSSLVTSYGITCIINVTETESDRPPLPGVEYFHIPVSDSPDTRLNDHFDEVADKIQSTCERQGRTLVHCKAGVSRSATLCMAYLMKYFSVPLSDAHIWVKSCRPRVRPNNGFWKQLIQYEKQLIGSNSIQMVTSSMGEIPDVYKEEVRDMIPL